MISLQTLPWQATTAELAAGTVCWETTALGMPATVEIVAGILHTDEAARMIVLRDGSWDAAAQRIR